MSAHERVGVWRLAFGVRRFGPEAREGSRPRDPWLPKPSTCHNRGR